jgi:hypothetical protein
MIESIVVGSVAFFIFLIVLSLVTYVLVYNQRPIRLENTATTAQREFRVETINKFADDLYAVRLYINLALSPLKKIIEKVQEALVSSNKGSWIGEGQTILLLAADVKTNLKIAADSIPEAERPADDDTIIDMTDIINKLGGVPPDKSFPENLERLLNLMSGFDIRRKIRGKEYRLGTRNEIVLLYFCQEALKNVIQHSRSNRLTISIRYRRADFSLTIKDKGIGFNPSGNSSDPKKTGKGFELMLSAARVVGADLAIRSKPNKGTTISIYIKTLST